LHQGRRPGIRRVEHRSHVIFYSVEQNDVLVTRILHKHMLARRQGL
jgi:plasmid stabilization system protein ParE